MLLLERWALLVVYQCSKCDMLGQWGSSILRFAGPAAFTITCVNS